MPQERPSRGSGERNISCEKYGKCLDVAAKKDWKTFNCEKCPGFITEQKKQPPKPPKIENKRVCERCGERPTMQPSSPYCSRCLTDMKRAKQTGANAPKKKNEGSNKPNTVKAQKTLDTAVKIDFGKYISVLKEIEILADRKMRSLDMQIVYMLSNQLKMDNDQVLKQTRDRLSDIEARLVKINLTLSSICTDTACITIASAVANPNPLIRMWGLKMLEIHGQRLFKTGSIQKFFEKFPESSDVPSFPKENEANSFSLLDQDPVDSVSHELCFQKKQKD